MKMAVPLPVTLDDVTYVFEPGQKCRSDWGRRCCGAGYSGGYGQQWWIHAHDSRNAGSYWVDRQEPVTVRIRICACRHCAHPPLGDLEDFRNAFMEDPEVASSLQYRRELKVERHQAHDARLWSKAALAACDGVPIEQLTPGLVKGLLEVR